MGIWDGRSEFLVWSQVDMDILISRCISGGWRNRVSVILFLGAGDIRKMIKWFMKKCVRIRTLCHSIIELVDA